MDTTISDDISTDSASEYLDVIDASHASAHDHEARLAGLNDGRSFDSRAHTPDDNQEQPRPPQYELDSSPGGSPDSQSLNLPIDDNICPRRALETVMFAHGCADTRNLRLNPLELLFLPPSPQRKPREARSRSLSPEHAPSACEGHQRRDRYLRTFSSHATARPVQEPQTHTDATQEQHRAGADASGNDEVRRDALPDDPAVSDSESSVRTHAPLEYTRYPSRPVRRSRRPPLDYPIHEKQHGENPRWALAGLARVYERLKQNFERSAAHIEMQSADEEANPALRNAPGYVQEALTAMRAHDEAERYMNDTLVTMKVLEKHVLGTTLSDMESVSSGEGWQVRRAGQHGTSNRTSRAGTVMAAIMNSGNDPRVKLEGIAEAAEIEEEGDKNRKKQKKKQQRNARRREAEKRLKMQKAEEEEASMVLFGMRDSVQPHDNNGSPSPQGRPVDQEQRTEDADTTPGGKSCDDQIAKDAQDFPVAAEQDAQIKDLVAADNSSAEQPALSMHEPICIRITPSSPGKQHSGIVADKSDSATAASAAITSSPASSEVEVASTAIQSGSASPSARSDETDATLVQGSPAACSDSESNTALVDVVAMHAPSEPGGGGADATTAICETDGQQCASVASTSGADNSLDAIKTPKVESPTTMASSMGRSTTSAASTETQLSDALPEANEAATEVEPVKGIESSKVEAVAATTVPEGSERLEAAPTPAISADTNKVPPFEPRWSKVSARKKAKKAAHAQKKLAFETDSLRSIAPAKEFVPPAPFVKAKSKGRNGGQDEAGSANLAVSEPGSYLTTGKPGTSRTPLPPLRPDQDESATDRRAVVGAPHWVQKKLAKPSPAPTASDKAETLGEPNDQDDLKTTRTMSTPSSHISADPVSMDTRALLTQTASAIMFSPPMPSEPLATDDFAPASSHVSDVQDSIQPTAQELSQHDDEVEDACSSETTSPPRVALPTRTAEVLPSEMSGKDGNLTEASQHAGSREALPFSEGAPATVAAPSMPAAPVPAGRDLPLRHGSPLGHSAATGRHRSSSDHLQAMAQSLNKPLWDLPSASVASHDQPAIPTHPRGTHKRHHEFQHRPERDPSHKRPRGSRNAASNGQLPQHSLPPRASQPDHVTSNRFVPALMPMPWAPQPWMPLAAVHYVYPSSAGYSAPTSYAAHSEHVAAGVNAPSSSIEQHIRHPNQGSTPARPPGLPSPPSAAHMAGRDVHGGPEHKVHPDRQNVASGPEPESSRFAAERNPPLYGPNPSALSVDNQVRADDGGTEMSTPMHYTQVGKRTKRLAPRVAAGTQTEIKTLAHSEAQTEPTWKEICIQAGPSYQEFDMQTDPVGFVERPELDLSDDEDEDEGQNCEARAPVGNMDPEVQEMLAGSNSASYGYDRYKGPATTSATDLYPYRDNYLQPSLFSVPEGSHRNNEQNPGWDVGDPPRTPSMDHCAQCDSARQSLPLGPQSHLHGSISQELLPALESADNLARYREGQPGQLLTSLNAQGELTWPQRSADPPSHSLDPEDARVEAANLVHRLAEEALAHCSIKSAVEDDCDYDNDNAAESSIVIHEAADAGEDSDDGSSARFVFDFIFETMTESSKMRRLSESDTTRSAVNQCNVAVDGDGLDHDCNPRTVSLGDLDPQRPIPPTTELHVCQEEWLLAVQLKREASFNGSMWREKFIYRQGQELVDSVGIALAKWAASKVKRRHARGLSRAQEKGKEERKEEENEHEHEHESEHLEPQEREMDQRAARAMEPSRSLPVSVMTTPERGAAPRHRPEDYHGRRAQLQFVSELMLPTSSPSYGLHGHPATHNGHDVFGRVKKVVRRWS